MEEVEWDNFWEVGIAGGGVVVEVLGIVGVGIERVFVGGRGIDGGILDGG